MPKKPSFRATGEWSELLRHTEHLIREESGEVYRVEPVDLVTFVTSQEYLKQDLWGISDAQREFLEVAADLENNRNFFVLFVGKGGGKNWASAVLFLYVVYKLLCMYDPHKYLDHNRDKAIVLINVAINAIQARKNFYDPMVSMLRHAGYNAFRQFGFDPDKDILSTSVQFPQNIEIMSANSRAGGIEGYDILVAMADEVDDVEFHSVEKIINTLRTSAQSRFRGKEKVIIISYRRYVGSSGKILEYFNQYKSLAHVYARRYASWEFHPARTREDFETYYKENPEKAACMYGSEISGSYIDSWIKDSKRIKMAMNINRKWIFDWPLPYQTSQVGSSEWWDRENHDEWRQSPMSEHEWTDPNGIVHTLNPYDIPIREIGNPNYQYVFCGDPALGSEANGGDGYGIAMGHRVVIKDEKGIKHPRIIVDFAFRFTGRMFEEGQVQMKAVEELIKKLKHQYGYNIKIFSFDGWNSASLTQWIAKTYKDAIVYHRNLVETSDYTTLRDAIFGEAPPSNGTGDKESNGGIDLPWHPIVFEELRNLREDRTKNPPKVDHPENGTKDISDVVAKLSRIIVHQWPFTDVLAAGTGINEQALVDKVSRGLASEKEQHEFDELRFSQTLGLGRIRQQSKGAKPISYKDIFPDI